MDTVAILHAILIAEGSAYSDRASDRGGPTKYGIDLATLTDYRGAPVTATDVAALTEAEALEIYQKRYVEAPGFLNIENDALRALLVDAGVQHDPEDAVKMLQRAAQVTPDGHLGPVTLAAVNAALAAPLYAAICAARIRLYGALISHDPQLIRVRSQGAHLQADNALGWANRIAQFVERPA
ncbi:MAG TPA: glycosyl hydrolase 108 family protein [Steroidobacteraceae bacterium]|jgi:lysozyme family protein